MMERMEGLEAGYVLLASPPTTAVSVLIFRNEADLKASEESHAAMRDRAAQIGVEFVSIDVYEVIAATMQRT